MNYLVRGMLAAAVLLLLSSFSIAGAQEFGMDLGDRHLQVSHGPGGSEPDPEGRNFGFNVDPDLNTNNNVLTAEAQVNVILGGFDTHDHLKITLSPLQ